MASNTLRRLNYILCSVVPLTILLRYVWPAHTLLTFLCATASMIPLASMLSESTEELTHHTGPAWGALLNVTFGNAGELIIGIFALREGLTDVVKASLTGSILVNLLLTLGIATVAGGIRNKKLCFDRLRARTQTTSLTLAAIALIFPAAYRLIAPHAAARLSLLSLELAGILLITYCLGLLFLLRTKTNVVGIRPRDDAPPQQDWSVAKALLVLAITAGLIGWLGEILVDSLEPFASQAGLSNFFIGLVVLAIAGNAAESVTAVRSAARNRMDLAVGIAAGSSTQIALFVAPVLVIISHWIAPVPLELVFSPIELLSLVVAILITEQIASDGESNWFEGVQLIVVYLFIAALVYLLPPSYK